MKANVRYKDSVFSSFLSEPKRLVEIYNAVEGTDYPLDTPVEINTLTDVLWKDQINDLSFILNGQMMVLIEHQSTINENMALRMLLYVARVYEKLLPEKAIYKRKRITIPTPKFIVFYNGQDPCPEHYRQILSDGFVVAEQSPMLELIVDVYNINYQQSSPLIEKSESLREYSLFIAQVNGELTAGYPFGEAVTRAIRYCMAHDIMKEYLRKNGSEVENMLLTEWDSKVALEVWKEEAIEDWREEFLKQGAEEGLRQGGQQGIEEGLERGQEQERRSRILALRDVLSPQVLAEKFEVPLDYVLQIQREAEQAEKETEEKAP